MTFTITNEEMLSDSEYASATSRPSTSFELPRSYPQSNASGSEKPKKRLRRGTGLPLPYFRFPHGRVDGDLEKIEKDIIQLLHLGETINEVEVGADSTIVTVNTRRELLFQGLKRDAHYEQNSSQPQDSTSTTDTGSSNCHRSSAKDLTRGPSPSPMLPLRPKQENQANSYQSASNLQETQDIQDAELTNQQSLHQSLTQIRTHLTALESAINTNISSQLLASTDSSQPRVADNFPSPSFKVEKKSSQTVGAVLGTVKVACAVERGLEALVGALELGAQGETEGNGGDKERGLMEACLAKPEEVALEMQRAIVGMRRVLKMDGKKN